MPNPCSVPKLLRFAIPEETMEQQLVCLAHDGAYAKGGSRKDRAIADATLLLGMLEANMDIDLAHKYHVAVRVCGGVHWFGGYVA